MDDEIKPMDEASKAKWLKIIADYRKKERKMLPIRRNQLSLWLGRLIIEYNKLEGHLGFVVADIIGELLSDEPAKARTLGSFSPVQLKASQCGLADMVTATLSFRTKMDFLVALLHKKFANNKDHIKNIDSIVGLLLAADEYRNRMVHSHWEVSMSEYARIKPKTKGVKGLRIEHHNADLRQIKEAIEGMEFLRVLGCTFLTEPTAFADAINEWKVDSETVFTAIRKNFQIPNDSQKQKPPSTS